MRFIAVFLSMLMSLNALAECPNAVSLHIGDVVKECPRIGLSIPYDAEVRKQLVEGDFNKKIIEQQKALIEQKDFTLSTVGQQRDLWKAESERLKTDLDKEKDRSSFTLWGGILAGVGLTVLAGWAIKQAGK